MPHSRTHTWANEEANLFLHSAAAKDAAPEKFVGKVGLQHAKAVVFNGTIVVSGKGGQSLVHSVVGKSAG